MNFSENITEATKSVKDNLLRTILTAAIIAIGITSLVGILTSIDAIEYNVTSGLAQLGANSFDIKTASRGRRSRGVKVAPQPPIEYDQAIRFKERFTQAQRVSITTFLSGSVEVKYLSKKSNPNSRVLGVDQYFLDNEGLNLEKGRNFSGIELQNGTPVAIIGREIANTLFDKEDPISKVFGMLNRKFQVIGVLEASGGIGGGGNDRTILIPVANARRVAGSQTPAFTLKIGASDPKDLDFLMGEATGLMRLIRKDQLGAPNSFEISRSESVAASLKEISGKLRIGAGVIGLVTLMGAAIGLMNIMMVSVTERTREIGVRKALGATPARIRQQFLIEAVVICLIGGFFGIIFGIVIGNLVALSFDNAAFVVPWLWIFLGFAVCIFVGIFSGYYPASKASKLDPIDSLRYE